MKALKTLIRPVNQQVSLRARLLGGFIGMAVAAILVILWFQYAVGEAGVVAARSARVSASIARAQSLKNAVMLSSQSVYDTAAGKEPDGTDARTKSITAMDTANKRLHADLDGSGPKALAALGEVEASLAKMKLVQELALTAGGREGAGRYFDRLREIETDIITNIDRIIAVREAELNALAHNSAGLDNRMVQTGVAALLIISGAAVALGLLVHMSVIEPVRRLRVGVDRISKGDLGARIAVDGRDEISMVSLEFNRMADNLEQSTGDQRRRYSQLTNLYKMSKAITAHKDLDKLLKLVLRQSLALIGADTGSIMLLVPGGNELMIRAAEGLDELTIKNTRVRLGEGISGAVAVTGKALIIRDDDPQSDHAGSGRDALSVPLVANKKVIGVINANNERDQKFDQSDLRFFTTIAGQIAAAVANATLVQDIQKAYFETIKVLAAAIDAKDKYTHGHSERVAKYAITVARQMNLSPEDLTRIEAAAYLHDIGKIGVPDHVLNKDGRLTEEEFAYIRNHPALAADILGHISFPWGDIIPGVRGHHERFDGRGYPDGLAAHDITLDARIIAVADTFDAMTSDRPYRRALDQNKAITELVQARGTQLDHEVVDAFIPALLTTLMSSVHGGIEEHLAFFDGQEDAREATLDMTPTARDKS